MNRRSAPGITLLGLAVAYIAWSAAHSGLAALNGTWPNGVRPASSHVSVEPGSYMSPRNIGIRDPAAVYCQEMGYAYHTAATAEGEQGICALPDSSACSAWAFYRGECGSQHSYCARRGLAVAARGKRDAYDRECTTCVLPDGTHRTVSELIRLDQKSAVGSARSASLAPRGERTMGTLGDLPDHFDWREHDGGDWMTPVKAQGTCASCWAFSAVGSVEAAYNLFLGDPDLDLDLSEEYLVSDCVSGSCCGGSHSGALGAIEEDGITDEACFPYVDADDCSCAEGTCDATCNHRAGGACSDATCSDRCLEWADRLWRVDEVGHVPSDIQAMQEHLIDRGPLSAAMGIGGGFGGYFDDGIYRCTDDSGVNHSVVIAGYDEAESYWIVKNSWGSDWHDGGYFKVGYAECSIESYVWYSDLVAQTPTPTHTPTATPTATNTPIPTPTTTPSPVVCDATSFPFSDGFESADLGTGWSTYTTNAGRIRLSSLYPHAGSSSLLLDSSGGQYSFAAAILTVDLHAQPNPVLDFWWREFNDEDHPVDGVFISDDMGTSWYRIYSFGGGLPYYQHVIIDLSARAASLDLTLNDCFQIKFQFYDNYQIPSDGYAIDDVQVRGPTAPTPTPTPQPTTTPTATPTNTPTRTPTITPTPPPTSTPTPCPTPTLTPTPTPAYCDAASFPLSDGFESSHFLTGWSTYATNGGRIRLSSLYPHAGTSSLLLDTTGVDGYNSTAAAILTVDLEGQSSVSLDFWWREFNDENHPADGVFISDDLGNTWHHLYSFNNGPSSYQQVIIDLDARAASLDLTLNECFQIKFQFYDNYQIPSDGYAIDDVQVRGTGEMTLNSMARPPGSPRA